MAAFSAMEDLHVQGLAVSYTPAGSTALVALHGAGAGTRDSSPLYTHLHETLPPLGIGVATFDRRGEGQSSGGITRGNFQAQAEDALAVADALGVARTGLWGISQGGWVAPLAATQSDGVAFLITIAATGVTPAEQMRYYTRRHLELAGYGPDVIERADTLRLHVEAWAHGEGSPPDLESAAGEPWFPLLYLPPALPATEAEQDAAKRSWIAEMDFDPRPVFAAVTVPTLCFYGELDSTSPVEPSVAAWPQATVIVIPDAEHDLTLPDGSLAPLYEERLVEWLGALS